jgi:hypothetical protein
MSCKLSLHSLLLKILREIVASVFSTMIGMKSLDLDIMLSLRPCNKCLVGIQSFIFGPQQLEPGIMQEIVSESHIVLSATNRSCP